MRNVVPRQGTEIGTRKQRNRTSQLRNVVPRQGTEMSDTTLSRVSLFLLRNVVPRQGTEIKLPTIVVSSNRLRNVVPRQGTEIVLMNGKSERQIEKCSSPTGDGNFKADVDNAITVNKELRNVVPRQGTEIFLSLTMREFK